jgi:hypothetical protein
VGAFIGRRDVNFSGERSEDKTKGRDSSWGVFGRKWCAVLGPSEMLDIGRDLVVNEVVHSFVEPSVVCDFDTVCFHVVPQDVLEGVWEIVSKEEAFTDVVVKFSSAFTRGSNPYSRTKCSEIAKIRCLVPWQRS